MNQSKFTESSPKSQIPIVEAQEARCPCGYLVAILRKEGVELKCKRCKRIIVLPFHTNGMDAHILKPCACP